MSLKDCGAKWGIQDQSLGVICIRFAGTETKTDPKMLFNAV